MLVIACSTMSIKPALGSERPTEYLLYKNTAYGFSIEYPTNWHHVRVPATSGKFSPVVYFAPDLKNPNAWLTVNYQKDYTAIRGLSDQQIVNTAISAIKKECQRYSFQLNGFTCSNPQFKTNVGSYHSIIKYEISGFWVKTLSDGSIFDMVSTWTIIPVNYDVYSVVTRLSSQESIVYQDEMTHMISSFNIYRVPQENTKIKLSMQLTQNTTLPQWIRNNAKWWSSGQINDSDFITGIQYLIKQEIIQIPMKNSSSSTNLQIPSWLKANAKLWASGQISDNEFVKGIQYLVQEGIIKNT